MKKWWILVFVLVIASVGIFIAAYNIDKPNVKTIPGGLVIIAGEGASSPYVQFPGTSQGSQDPETGAEPTPDPEPFVIECLECPEDGIVINLGDLGIGYGDLTDEMVSNMTNCTNVTQLVAVDCPPPTNMTVNVTCGDGVCEGNETVENCPEDCEAICGDGVCEGNETVENCPEDCNNTFPQEGDSGDEDPEENGGNGEEDAESDTESEGESEALYHYECTFNGECKKIFDDPSEPQKLSTCDPRDGKCEPGASPTDGAPKPQLNPSDLSISSLDNAFRKILSSMFGLPP